MPVETIEKKGLMRWLEALLRHLAQVSDPFCVRLPILICRQFATFTLPATLLTRSKPSPQGSSTPHIPPNPSRSTLSIGSVPFSFRSSRRLTNLGNTTPHPPRWSLQLPPALVVDTAQEEMSLHRSGPNTRWQLPSTGGCSFFFSSPLDLILCVSLTHHSTSYLHTLILR